MMELRKESFFQKTWRLMCKYWQIYVLMLPGILFFLVIKVFPVWGLSIAFVDFKIKKGILGSAFVGLKWFDKFLSGPSFGNIFRNTMAISLMDLLIAFPVPILLSLGFNEMRHMKYKSVLQSVVYMPHFMSWVVISGITFLLFSADMGIVNKFIRMITGNTVNFLTNKNAYWWVAAVSVHLEGGRLGNDHLSGGDLAGGSRPVRGRGDGRREPLPARDSRDASVHRADADRHVHHEDWPHDEHLLRTDDDDV